MIDVAQSTFRRREMACFLHSPPAPPSIERSMSLALVRDLPGTFPVAKRFLWG
jgi:hypothetical protein